MRAPLMVALAALLVATASATQDIVIDAFRVEYLPTDAQAAGMAYFVAAYRIGMLVSTAGSVALVAYLEYQRHRPRWCGTMAMPPWRPWC